MNHIDRIKKPAKPILRRYGVKRAGLFGSWARGDMTGASDIDILVETGENMSLFEFVRFSGAQFVLGHPMSLPGSAWPPSCVATEGGKA